MVKSVVLGFVLILFFSSYVYAQEDSVKIWKYDPWVVPLKPAKSLYEVDKFHFHKENGLSLYKQRLNPSSYSFSSPKELPFVNTFKSKFLLPASLLMFGVVNRNRRTFDQMDVEPNKYGAYDQHVTSVDDYLRYVPYLSIYGFDLMGIKAKHTLRDRTFVLLTSYVLMDQAVDHLKDGMPTLRPNGASERSFPSSHTSTAFVGAHILFREYKDSSPWLASTGYIFAVTTGALRMVNRCHSFADVMAGAGIGILSVEAAYLLLPLFQKVVGRKDKKLVIAPSVGLKNVGLGLAYTF